MATESIRIGTLVDGIKKPEKYIAAILRHGFESFSLMFWGDVADLNLEGTAARIGAVLEDSNAVISSLAIYDNPLDDGKPGETCRAIWNNLVDAAPLFGCDVVAGFAGGVQGKSVPDCMTRFSQVFSPIAKRAADNGVRLAFENCHAGGDWNSIGWNIAICPAAWDLMFDAIPLDNVGLEWEPCHQMVQLIDPMPQLRRYVDRIFHLHGKDATILWDVIRTNGIHGREPFAFHRTPGFGDSNWTDIISCLRAGGYVGSIDIEGWHDPVYRDELELTGQIHGLNYLKSCRGGDFVPNP